MKPSELPIARDVRRGEALRTLIADAVSEVQVDASKRGGVTVASAQLHAMLTAGATAIASLRDLVAPAISTRTQAFGAAKIVLTYGKPLDPAFVPPTSAFAITDPNRTVTGVAVVGRTVEVSYSGVVLVTADAPLIAYTQPTADLRLRDQAGNLAASFTAAAVTVAAS